MLFEDATSQYIDDSGKTRMLTFGNLKLSLMVSPLPPFNLPIDRTVLETPYETAKQFMKRKGLRPISQDGSESDGKIWGLWVDIAGDRTISLYYAYIPLVERDALPNLPFVDPTKNDPIRTEPVANSDLRRYQNNRKTADFLKRYVLYAYARDPDAFDENSFTVVKGYTYKIEDLNKRLFFDGNRVMFRNGKLIVPSEHIRDQLMAYLEVALLNDRQGVLKLKDERSLDVFYQSIADFRPAPNQLVFMSKEAVARWKRETLRTAEANLIKDELNSSAVEPYYYRNPRFQNNAIVIIQNVMDGSLERAITVATAWIDERSNIGYRAAIPDEIDKLSYALYYTDGKVEEVKSEGETIAPVIVYDNDTYGALLFV